MSSLIAGPPRVDDVVIADSVRRSRLFRLNDGVLIGVLIVPQLAWLAVVAYLLHIP